MTSHADTGEATTGLPTTGLIDAQGRFAAGKVRGTANLWPPYLPVLRFTLLNMTGFALLVAAYFQGWIDTVIAADSTRLVFVIFGMFLLGLAIAGRLVWRVSDELNHVSEYKFNEASWAASYFAEVKGRGSGSRAITASALRMKMANRISAVRHLANSLVLLGLIGTVLGFIIALSGVDPERAADVSSIAPLVGDLIAGMSVALFTTLVGAVLNIWLMVNYRILSDSAVNLTAAIVGAGEANERPRSI